MKNLSKTKQIIISLSFILLVAVLGSIFVNIGSDWFGSLTTPSEWVPDFVFPVVWTTIYLSFAIIFSLWIKKENIPQKTYILGLINGILNVVWCLVFFTANQLLWGAVVIVINLIMSFVFVVDILKQKRVYGYILSIYPVWLSLATALNLAVWILN